MTEQTDGAPVVDKDEAVAWIAEETGLPSAIVSLCLDLEHDMKVASGIVKDSEHQPMLYSMSAFLDGLDQVDEQRLVGDAFTYLGVAEHAAAAVYESQLEYLVHLGLREIDEEPWNRIISDVDASPHVILEGIGLEGASLTRVDRDQHETLEVDDISHPAAAGLRGWCIESGGIFELRAPGRPLEVIDRGARLI